MKCGYSVYFFLNFENLICGGIDISKYFRESLRDNVSTVVFLLDQLKRWPGNQIDFYY